MYGVPVFSFQLPSPMHTHTHTLSTPMTFSSADYTWRSLLFTSLGKLVFLAAFLNPEVIIILIIWQASFPVKWRTMIGWEAISVVHIRKNKHILKQTARPCNEITIYFVNRISANNFLFSSTKCLPIKLLICISRYAFLVCPKYK